MARVSKPPDVRREELLDTALSLCTTIGFDALAVEQITSAAGVAKGTFYYYFSSKQDLLAQLVQRFSDELFAALEEHRQQPTGTALDEFRTLLVVATQWKLGRAESSLEYIPLLYKPENADLRRRFYGIWFAQAWQLFHPVIARGHDDGSFRVDDPEPTTEIVLSIWLDAATRGLERALAAPTAAEFADILARLTAALATGVERVLGAEPGSLAVPVEPDALAAMHGPLLAALHPTADRKTNP